MSFLWGYFTSAPQAVPIVLESKIDYISKLKEWRGSNVLRQYRFTVIPVESDTYITLTVITENKTIHVKSGQVSSGLTLRQFKQTLVSQLLTELV